MDEIMRQQEADNEFAEMLTAIDSGNMQAALVHIERAMELNDTPQWSSYLGLCLATQRGQHRRGIELCQSALALEPENPVHFLNLAKIHLAKGDRAEGIRVLRAGMAAGGSPELVQQLEMLGMRKRAVIPVLSRNNPLNRYLGLIFSRFGLR